MDWMKQFGGMLGGDQGDPDKNFDRLSQAAPKSSLVSALTSAFRSDQTPPLAQMVTQLFGNSDNNTRAGLLNHLMAFAPALLSSRMGDVLGGPSGTKGITPEQAAQVPPERVGEIASEAETSDPSFLDRISEFYADRPGIVKSLGGSALSVMMAKVSERFGTGGA